MNLMNVYYVGMFGYLSEEEKKEDLKNIDKRKFKVLKPESTSGLFIYIYLGSDPMAARDKFDELKRLLTGAISADLLVRPSLFPVKDSKKLGGVFYQDRIEDISNFEQTKMEMMENVEDIEEVVKKIEDVLTYYKKDVGHSINITRKEIIKILTSSPTKWEEFVEKEMWGFEKECDEEDLKYVSPSRKTGVYVLDGRDIFWHVISPDVGMVIEELSDGIVIYINEKLYKVDDYGWIYWVMKKDKNKEFYWAVRGYGTFERAKREALRIERSFVKAKD